MDKIKPNDDTKTLLINNVIQNIIKLMNICCPFLLLYILQPLDQANLSNMAIGHIFQTWHLSAT